MFLLRPVVLVAAALFLVGLCGQSHAGYLSAYASCDGNTISFHWEYDEYEAVPPELPEWVGYDVLRRPLGQCGEYERVNAKPFPRMAGSHSHTYNEPAPTTETTYEYRVILVDANRQSLIFSINVCECGNNNTGWASCPSYSAPLTQGTLEDWGWALYVQACPGSCYRNFFFQGALADELRPFAGTGTAFRFYGPGRCGSIEGCFMSVVDRYESASCNSVTAALAKTWGQLKLHYR